MQISVCLSCDSKINLLAHTWLCTAHCCLANTQWKVFGLRTLWPVHYCRYVCYLYKERKMHASDVEDTKHRMHNNHSHSGHITITVTTIAVTDDTVYCPPVTSIHFVYASFLITGSRDQMRPRPWNVVGCLERQSTGPGGPQCCVMRSVFYLRKSLLASVSSHSGGVFPPRPCFFSAFPESRTCVIRTQPIGSAPGSMFFSFFFYQCEL